MRPTLLALLGFASLSAADVKVTPNEAVDVAQDGKVVARFMMSHDVSTPAKRLDHYKPYLHVFDPSGALRLTKGPGFNFTHHRGIMLGFAKITVDGKTYDRWHMTKGDQVVTAVKPTDDGFVATIDWQGATGFVKLKTRSSVRIGLSLAEAPCQSIEATKPSVVGLIAVTTWSPPLMCQRS